MRPISPGLTVRRSVGVGRDVELDHPVDVFVFGRPREGGDRVAERDATVKTILCKEGDSLAVDAVIMEFS